MHGTHGVLSHRTLGGAGCRVASETSPRAPRKLLRTTFAGRDAAGVPLLRDIRTARQPAVRPACSQDHPLLAGLPFVSLLFFFTSRLSTRIILVSTVHDDRPCVFQVSRAPRGAEARHNRPISSPAQVGQHPPCDATGASVQGRVRWGRPHVACLRRAPRTQSRDVPLEVLHATGSSCFLGVPPRRELDWMASRAGCRNCLMTLTLPVQIMSLSAYVVRYLL